MRGRPVAYVIAGLLAVAGGAVVQSTGVLHAAEGATVDARFAAAARASPGGLVVVGVDSDTFTTLHHQWPFPRCCTARHRPPPPRRRQAIVYDVQFTGADGATRGSGSLQRCGAGAAVVLATTGFDNHGHSDVLGGDENLAGRCPRRAANLAG